MNCNSCKDRLPDFLLDELSPSESVLVHEHLNLCEDCMRAYLQLKGTGKALEAVPSLQALRPSDQFEDTLRSVAREESQKIIRTLPPDKRVRMELRQERFARRKPEVAGSGPKKSSSPVTYVALLAAAAGIVIAAFILMSPSRGYNQLPVKVGLFTRTVDDVKTFFQKAGETWSEAKVGTLVRTGDTYATGPSGRARIGLEEGGALFLAPNAEIKVRPPETAGGRWSLELVRGELLVERPARGGSSAKAEGFGWNIQVAERTVKIGSGTEAILDAGHKDTLQRMVSVGSGFAMVQKSGESDAVKIVGGKSCRFQNLSISKVHDGGASIWPDWRLDLLSDEELGGLLDGNPKLKGHKDTGLLVELRYGFGKSKGLTDWVSNVAGKSLRPSKGAVGVPTEARFALKAQLAAPLNVELGVQGNSDKELSFTFTADQSESHQWSLDLDQEAKLQVRQHSSQRVTRAPFHAEGRSDESVNIGVEQKGPETLLTLSTSSGEAKPLVLSEALSGPFSLWFSAHSEEFSLHSIRIQGVVSRDWIRKRLGQK